MKKIAVGDLGEFWYGDYKEPFVQLEGAVTGHPQGVVLKDDEGKVMCAYCGQTFDHLGSHVVHKHGITAREYKEEVGLMGSSALVSERVRVGYASRMRHRIATGSVHMDAMRSVERTPEVKARRIASRRRTLGSSEKENLTGRCYAQMLVVAQSIHREHGQVTDRHLRARGIPRWAWRRYFDTVEDFAQAAGSTARTRHRTWSDGQLLAALRALADKLGRTPTHSDLKRFGMPIPALRRRWKTYSLACVAAGLDPNLPGGTSQFDEADHVRMLVAYATTGSMIKAATVCGVNGHIVSRALYTYGFPFPARTGSSTAEETRQRKAWAADMARRLAGWPDQTPGVYASVAV